MTKRPTETVRPAPLLRNGAPLRAFVPMSQATQAQLSAAEAWLALARKDNSGLWSRGKGARK